MTGVMQAVRSRQHTFSQRKLRSAVALLRRLSVLPCGATRILLDPFTEGIAQRELAGRGMPKCNVSLARPRGGCRQPRAATRRRQRRAPSLRCRRRVRRWTLT